MSTQREFWSDIGRGSGDGETCGRFLPTPRAADSVTGWSAKDAKRKNGMLLTAIKHGTLTSSAVASPARTSAMLARVRDWTENGLGYSTKQPASFARWDQDTCSWKTSQLCLAGGLETFSGRWPRSGTMRNGIAYRLPPLVPRISGTGCSLWPTASASDWKDSENDGFTPLGRAFKPHPTRGQSINQQVKTDERGGQLSPGFVEWLMGFPKDWTKLEE